MTVTVCSATRSVPERGLGLGLAAISIATVPLPVPLVAPVSVSQASFEVAVHEHDGVVVTSVLLEPDAGPAEIVRGDTANEQLVAAAWSTVTVWPAIVSVPERGDVSAFSAIENNTVALPVPLAALVSVSQDAFATAVHAHEDGVVMSTLPEPAAARADTFVDDSENEHGAAAWLTVNVWPATVSVPARGVGSVLAATENCTVPLPVPDAPAVIDSHETLAVADHAQPPTVVTSTEPVALDAPTDCEVADSGVPSTTRQPG